jgi:hypothetical protein
MKMDAVSDSNNKQILCNHSGGNEGKPRDKRIVIAAIISARRVFVDAGLASIVESQWINYDDSTLPSWKCLDDGRLRIFGPSEHVKSGVHHSLWKLARYYTACGVLHYCTRVRFSSPLPGCTLHPGRQCPPPKSPVYHPRGASTKVWMYFSNSGWTQTRRHLILGKLIDWVTNAHPCGRATTCFYT